jgi:hypothetical protein
MDKQTILRITLICNICDGEFCANTAGSGVGAAAPLIGDDQSDLA